VARETSASRLRKAIEVSGGRRFILALGSGIMTTVLQWLGKLDANGSTYAMVIIGTVGSYLAANTLQKKNDVKAE
jgi:hypothetical protein